MKKSKSKSKKIISKKALLAYIEIILRKKALFRNIVIALTVLDIAFKLTGRIDWPWLIVISPLWSLCSSMSIAMLFMTVGAMLKITGGVDWSWLLVISPLWAFYSNRNTVAILVSIAIMLKITGHVDWHWIATISPLWVLYLNDDK